MTVLPSKDLAAVAEPLFRLLAHSHSPYSKVQVACAVETAGGGLHFGVNVENAAYPQGWCAETSAIGAAVTAGERVLTRVFVTSNLPDLIWPCGGCRQKIFELAAKGCEVVSVTADGREDRRTIEALLPLGFRLDETPTPE